MMFKSIIFAQLILIACCQIGSHYGLKLPQNKLWQLTTNKQNHNQKKHVGKKQNYNRFNKCIVWQDWCVPQ